ncbi:hypothetical protein MMC10_004850 [Thelotrema lepadinum]|nr:hypothetical protein [Thelotrema lepadinum]
MPIITPVRQSASKEEFLKALGLNGNTADKARFQQMWEEVTGFWVKNFETTKRHILKPEYAASPGVQRPYKWAHLDPAVIDNAITTIWKDGRPLPRMYYDLGAHDDRRIYNWVLKWLLWHVCRYRDWRNRKSKPSTASDSQVPQSPPTPVADSDGMPPKTYWETVMN